MKRMAAGAKFVAGVMPGRPFMTMAPRNFPRYLSKSAGDETSTSSGVPETRPFVLGLHASGWAMTWRYCGSVISTLKRVTSQPGPGKPPGSNDTRSSPQSLQSLLGPVRRRRVGRRSAQARAVHVGELAQRIHQV